MTLRWRPAAWHLALALGGVGVLVYFLVPTGGLAQAAVYQYFSVGATVAIVVGIRLWGKGPLLHWWLLAAGTACWSAGDLIAAIDANVASITLPYPSVVDVLYLLGYPLILAAIAVVIRSMGKVRAVNVLDGAIAAAGPALAMWVLLVQPQLSIAGYSTTASLVTAAYPAGDILLLVGCAQLLVRSSRRSFALAALTAGVCILVLTDIVYGHLSLTDRYFGGMWLDAGWLVSYSLWGAAALHPSMRRLRGRTELDDTRLNVTRTVVLNLSLLAPFLILLVQSRFQSKVDYVPIGVGGIMIVLLVSARVVLLRRAGDRVGALLRASESRLRELYEEAEQSRAALADQNAELHEVDRLKDELIAMVSHELRTPLTSILGYLELVTDGDSGPLEDDQRKYLAVVQRNGERLLRLVSDLLFVAQVEAGRLALECGPLPLSELVDECVSTLRPSAEAKGIEVKVVHEREAVVEGDRARVAQVLDNLLSNAVKFTPAGGRIEVRLDRLSGEAVLEIADSGIGISEADQASLFTRFFRAQGAMEAAIQGTGLGLSICKAIVEAHGGTIAVVSTQGEGSRFAVHLPLRIAAVQPAPASAAA